jgi:hypothetical protein
VRIIIHLTSLGLFFNLLSKNIKMKMYGTVILSVVLAGRKTSSLTFREEHRFRVVKNRVLGNVFWPHEGRGKREVEKTT